MTKRRRNTYLLLSVAALGLLAWLLFGPSEPEYQGKKLSRWLWEMEIAPDTASLAWKESVQAVQAMGTNAVPSLLAMLRTRDSAWKRQIVSWTQEALGLELEDYLAKARREMLALREEVFTSRHHRRRDARSVHR